MLVLLVLLVLLSASLQLQLSCIVPAVCLGVVAKMDVRYC